MSGIKLKHGVSSSFALLLILLPQYTTCSNGGVLQFEDILPEDPSTYDKMRPPKKEGKPTVVYFHVTVMSIDSINENSMTFAADIFFAQSWKDFRLRLPENMTSEYRLLELDWLGQMWRPDSYFKNAKQVTFQTMTIPNHYVWLYQSKSILYMVKLTLTLSCAMNYAIYPHDTQECRLQMESLSHTTEDLVFEWDPDTPLVVDSNIELPQFDLVNNFTADCSQEYSTGNFTCLEVVFQLRRRLGYYLFHTYMPTCLIVIMSWISFWIRPEAAPARVTLGVTSLLTLSTQHAKSQASLPPVSYIKIIDMFMSTCTIFVFLALMEYALVNIVLGDGPEGVCPPPKKKNECGKSKSRFFIPMIISGVKKRCKERTSGIVQAFNFSSVPSMQNNHQDEGNKFCSNTVNAISAVSHSRSSTHPTTCTSDSHCHSPYALHGRDMYPENQSPTNSPRACHHIECQVDHHGIPLVHHCSEPPCYSVHPPDQCCGGHPTSQPYCSSAFPTCSHVVNPHSCHSNYYCLPQQYSERRNSVSHCSSYCSPIGEAHRTGSHSDFIGHTYYSENEHATVSSGALPSHSCMVQRHHNSEATPSQQCSTHSCDRKATRRQSGGVVSERRSRSVDRSSERLPSSVGRSKRHSSRSTERHSDPAGKWKTIEWRSDVEEKEIQTIEGKQPPSATISCEPSTSNPAPNEEPSTSSTNFSKVPTPPPPPPNKPAGLTQTQKRRARAIMIDRFSRVFFPLTFGLINAVYWIIFWVCL